MRIEETAMRPALQGGGWSKQTRVRDLGAAETMPEDAVEVDAETPATDWKTAEASAETTPKAYAGQSASTNAMPAAGPSTTNSSTANPPGVSPPPAAN